MLEANTRRVRYTRVLPMTAELAPLVSFLHTKFKAPTSNLITSSSNTQRSEIPNVKRDRDMVFVLPKFELRRVLLSDEGAVSDPAKASS